MTKARPTGFESVGMLAFEQFEYSQIGYWFEPFYPQSIAASHRYCHA